MKSLILFLIIISNLIYPQNNVIADSLRDLIRVANDLLLQTSIIPSLNNRIKALEDSVAWMKDSLRVHSNIIWSTIDLSEKADIYVDATNGNDLNNGSKMMPVRSIGRALELVVPILSQRRGYIALKAGEVFNENVIIENDSITITSYGTGLKPKITNWYDLPNWNNQNTWTYLDTNKWEMNLGGDRIYRLWINGTEVKQAHWNNNTGEGLSPTNIFSHSYASYIDKLVIYSTTNPASAFTSMKIACNKVNNLSHTIEVNANYVVLKNLDIQNGMYASLTGSGSYVEVIDCNIGYNANRNGIAIPGKNMSNFGNNWTFKRDTIFSNWVYSYYFYDDSTPEGLYIKSNNSIIDSCYIKDWWFGIYSAGVNNRISHNDISAPNFSYGKGVHIYNDNPSNNYAKNLIYNNYIHAIKAIAISINNSGNKIYYNIIENMLLSSNSNNVNQGNAIELLTGLFDVDSNYIFNNTIFNCQYSAIIDQESLTYNNLFLNTYLISTTSDMFAMNIWDMTDGEYRNNLFYNTGSTSSNYFIYVAERYPYIYTVNTFNNIGGAVSNNIYPSQNMSQIINNNFTLPSGSSALNMGIDVRHLISTGLTDRWGNSINDTPNIGAWNGTP